MVRIGLLRYDSPHLTFLRAWIMRDCCTSSHCFRVLPTGWVHCYRCFRQQAMFWVCKGINICKGSICNSHWLRSQTMKLGLMGTTVFHSSGDNGVAGNGGVCLNLARTSWQKKTIVLLLLTCISWYRWTSGWWHCFQSRVPSEFSDPLIQLQAFIISRLLVHLSLQLVQRKWIPTPR